MTVTLALAAGCSDFATPAELDREQVLAIIAEPPAIAPGERAQISVLVAGPDGELDSVITNSAEWASVPPVPGTLPLGTLEEESGTLYYVAPALQPEMNPAVGLVEITLDVGRDQPLVANKAIAVGSILLSNPVLESFTADGDDLLSATSLSVSVGAAVAIEIGVVDGLPLDGFVSWYTTLGAIEFYRSNPTEIVFEEAGEGWLFAVARDGRGGIAWSKVRVVAE